MPVKKTKSPKKNPVIAKVKIGDEELKITENRLAAALSYVWVLCLLPLLGQRHDKFVQAHAKQGLVLFLVELVGMLFFWVPLFGQLLFLALVGLSIAGIYKALSGKTWTMPILGRYAEEINF